MTSRTSRQSSDSVYTVVEFVAEIKLTDEDLAAADNDPGQAVQNVIGHTGACVSGVECTWKETQ